MLFTELLRATPICDDPDSHETVEKVLYRYKESANEVDRSAEDEKTMRDRMEKTWTIEDRIQILGQVCQG